MLFPSVERVPLLELIVTFTNNIFLLSILSKQGSNIMGGANKQSDMLMIEKKDIQLLLKVVKTQL